MGRTRVRWGRVGALIVAVATLGAAATSAVAANRSGAAPGGDAAVYTVRPGDTLWAIARREVGSAGDPRPMVAQLIERNGIAGGRIRPGESILVPAGGS
jgi:Tfp pilus assembly protein FimV